jgi:hypothetical protein
LFATFHNSDINLLAQGNGNLFEHLKCVRSQELVRDSQSLLTNETIIYPISSLLDIYLLEWSMSSPAAKRGAMSSALARNAYGKSGIRLTKVTRHAVRQDSKEITVNVQLEGDFALSYLWTSRLEW